MERKYRSAINIPSRFGIIGIVNTTEHKSLKCCFERKSIFAALSWVSSAKFQRSAFHLFDNAANVNALSCHRSWRTHQKIDFSRLRRRHAASPPSRSRYTHLHTYFWNHLTEILTGVCDVKTSRSRASKKIFFALKTAAFYLLPSRTHTTTTQPEAERNK